MRSPIPNPICHSLSGPLGGNGDSYKVELVGPGIDAKSFRQLIKILEMTAEWIEEDDASGRIDPIRKRLIELAEDGKPPVAPHCEVINSPAIGEPRDVGLASDPQQRAIGN